MFCPLINYEKQLSEILIKKVLSVSCAESCTGGLISSLLTDVSGSSSFIKSNFVTYSNEAKEKYLFVKPETLNNFGAVSKETAFEMAKGLLKQSGTDFALSITGVAGPTGGTKEKPVGLCFVGISYLDKTATEKIIFPKWLPRKVIKYLFAKKAIYLLKKFIKENLDV